uniref:Uncharacterized protein n=1 Tax=Arundo donax TaxID=35708 RepID=A0A0A9CI14_ARUDO
MYEPSSSELANDLSSSLPLQSASKESSLTPCSGGAGL